MELRLNIPDPMAKQLSRRKCNLSRRTVQTLASAIRFKRRRKVTLDPETLPVTVCLQMQSVMSSYIQRTLEAQGLTEEDVLADFEASRKARRSTDRL